MAPSTPTNVGKIEMPAIPASIFVPEVDEEKKKALVSFSVEEEKALKKFPFASIEKRDNPRDRAWVAINEDVAYPWALTILEKGEPPYITPNQRAFVGKAEVFSAALKHKEGVAEELHEARAALLELARQYFTKAMHLALKERPGFGVHIVDNPASKGRWKQ